MKEAYFTPDTLAACTLAFQQELEGYQQKRDPPFLPQNSALLVLDMQGYFLDPSSHAYVPSAAAILTGLKALTHTYARQGRPVIFTQHVNTPEDAGKMSTWWRGLITTGEPLAAIVPEFDLSTGIVLTKTQYDAFYGTPLEEILRERGVKQVVIGGVMTHLCCETTARSAFMRGFDVFFLIDGTATYQRDYHRASLLNLAHGFATLVTVNDLLAQEKRVDAK